MFLIFLTISYYTATAEDLKDLSKGLFIVFIVYIFIYVQIAVHNTLLYERLLKKRKFKLYIFFLIVLWTICSLINIYSNYGVSGDEPEGILAGVSSALFILILGFGIYAIHENIILKNINFQNKLVSKEEEIRYLKAQLNPHFLFNALNNLYGSALSAPHDTADKILALSNLLRYQIESSQKEAVALKDEIDYLKMYIDYELNRNKNLKMNFIINGDDNKISIPPLLLMPFIENAIKFSNETDQPKIDMQLDIAGNIITFTLVNNYTDDSKKQMGTNTGIANTQKRLDIYFEKKHSLLIKKNHQEHKVCLTLTI
jgi:sensor histidine kinase YesM